MRRNRNLIRIHLWVPEIFGFKGGIQVYSAFLIETLKHLYPSWQYEVFLKHDTRASAVQHNTFNLQFHGVGNYPLPLRTAAYAAQTIGSGVWKRPDLVIATHLNFTDAAYWLNRLTGIPYWTVAHGIEAWDIQKPTLNRALQSADRILSVSHYTRERLLAEQNLDPAKVSLLPNTFDASHFHLQPKPQYLLDRYNLKADQTIILTVARLESSERYKGYDQILLALPQICQQLPDVHYLIVGKGPDRERVEQLIRELNLQDRVTLAGFIPDSELCDHYNVCDVFAMPSKAEGFGIVYLEALACGKPTIGGNQAGSVDALCNGELGALVDPDDIDAIATTLIQIVQGDYPNSRLYQPDVLRQAVIDKFGIKSFELTLASYFAAHTHPTPRDRSQAD
jgi:glycosyltransferase involved in cell wall biosynthesis